MNASLPIHEIGSSILEALRRGNQLVLVAPPGSGKTTQVPQMILDAGLAGTGQIVILQPRRVAARTVAARVAWERHSKLGDEVGYQVRFDDRTSVGTRICFVTEGILLRWMQDAPRIPDVSVLLFDEFHERNLMSDVALAMAKHLQRSSRPELKIVVMSATLEAEPVAAYLSALHPGLEKSHAPGPSFLDPEPFPAPHPSPPAPAPCPILTSQGQTFPVEVYFQDYADRRPIVEQAAEAVERIVRSGEAGDILVFMPGVGEIRSTIRACAALSLPERLRILPLHGELAPSEQDAAFEVAPMRKVVVATNVAETSVTIDGIRHVVDGGLARISRYDAERGIGMLVLEPISRASADQRRGRAGRTAPGACYRLWTESSHLNRADRNTPEIQRADLAEVVLFLHSLDVPRAAEFDWLDRPDLVAVRRAEHLLLTLGAIDPANGKLTGIGRQMMRLPMHPRFARMLVQAGIEGCLDDAALCAALASGRDLLIRLRGEDNDLAKAREVFERDPTSDFFTLIEAHRWAREHHFSLDACRPYGIHAQTARQIEQTYQQFLAVARRHRLQSSRSADRRGVPEQSAEVEDLIPEGASEPEEESGTLPQAASQPAAVPDDLPQPPDLAASGCIPLSDAGSKPETARGPSPLPRSDRLRRCLTAGFIDQLCVRRDLGSLDCDMIDERRATLVRESVVQKAKCFVAATAREVVGKHETPRTLVALATAVEPHWLGELFPQHLVKQSNYVFDRTHKRVAALNQICFANLVIHQEHERNLDPADAGKCLAEAALDSLFELPLLTHELKQFMARVNLVCVVMPDLDFPPFDPAGLEACLAKAFSGKTLAKEAQATPLKEAIHARLAPEQVSWLNELAPQTIPWPDGRNLKLVYPTPAYGGSQQSPELQAKLHECFQLKKHPLVCEGRLPINLCLATPDGKRLDVTTDWPAFKATQYPRLKSALIKKFPGVGWL